MTDHIAGNPASFPATVALFEDSDSPDAAHFNLGPIDLADRTANLDARVTTEVAARVAALTSAINALYKIVDVKSLAITAGGYGSALADGASSSYVNLDAAVTFTSECNAGDVIVFWMSANIGADNASVGDFVMQIVDGGTSVMLTETQRQTDDDASIIGYCVSSRYVLSHVTSGGTASVQWFGKRSTGVGHFKAYIPVSLVAVLLRPGT